MSIRNKHQVWVPEAMELALTLEETLKPIYEKYKEKLSPEDIFYVMCNEMNRYITADVVNQKRIDFEKFKQEKGID